MVPTLSLAETETHYANHSSARTLLLITSCLGAMIGPLSLATTNLALPSIAIDLEANAKTISWIPMGFLVSSVMFMLPAGKLADIFGRKRALLVGIAASTIFSIFSSLVQSIEWLIFLRFLQGFSMAIVFSSGLAILVSVFSDQQRGMAMGWYSGSVYFALTISPFLGGWVTEHLGWRTVFWIQVPLSVLVFAFLLFWIPGEWRKEGRAFFDWTGSAIFAGWAATFVYGVSGLPNWTSVLTLLISACYLWLFVWHQSRVENPLISMRLFTQNRVFSFSLAAAVLMYSVNFPMAFLLSIFLQISKGLTPTHAGLIMLFQAFTMAVIAPIAGRVSDRVEPRVVATLGCCCCILGFLLIGIASNMAPIWTIAAGLVCVGFGFGFFTTPNNSAAMGAIEKSELGTASAAVNLARTIGNLFGMSLMALVIHALIGAQEFTPELSSELLRTMHIWMIIAGCFAMLAATLSFARGRTRNQKSRS